LALGTDNTIVYPLYPPVTTGVMIRDTSKSYTVSKLMLHAYNFELFPRCNALTNLTNPICWEGVKCYETLKTVVCDFLDGLHLSQTGYLEGSTDTFVDLPSVITKQYST
jgi:hypothetical protein